ncbi:MAG: 2-dehydropantoate 2-reductase [Phycisphaerales bacterium]|nr:2-dehydropantoate 2-reductase [Phycisphaerales bacterium]
MNSFDSIAIIGAGALGGYYGGRLAHHGFNVHMLLRSDYDHVREHGLSVRSVSGDFRLPPDRFRVYNDPTTMPKADLVIVTLKSTENHEFHRLITPLLHDKTAILTLQNGLGNEDDLARLFGPQRVLGGIAFVCINRVAPGELRHTEAGFIRLGEFAGDVGRSERAERIVEMFNRSNVKAHVTDGPLRAARWAKLVWNIPFNGLGALLDATTDQLLASEEGTDLVRAIMMETIAAAAADGVALPPGMPDQLIATTREMGAYRTSTQIDRQTGKAMEIDAIFGRPLAIAKRGNLAVPLLQFLHVSLSHVNRSIKR